MKEEIENLQKKIEEIVTPIIESYDCELLFAEITGDRKRLIVRLYIDRKGWEIDSPSKVTINLCSLINREISALLDIEDPIKGAYTLEVSSPGIERILKKKEHFIKAKGHPVKLQLKESYQNRKRFLGVVKDVTEDSLIIREEGDKEDKMVPFNLIKKGNLKVF